MLKFKQGDVFMNELKKEFLKNNNLITKEYVDKKTNKLLNKKFQEAESIPTDEFEGYLYEQNEDGEYDFYKEVEDELTEKDIQQIIMYQNNKYLKNINKNIKFITTILKIYVILVVIYIILYLFLLDGLTR